jgi:hypothetical protein
MFTLATRRPMLVSAPDDGAGSGGEGGGDGGKPPEGKPDPPKPDGDGGKPPEGNVDELPDWARKALTKANNEAAGYRTKVRELEPLAQKAKELEDAGKTDAQRLSEERDGHKSRADTAETGLLRMEVAIDKAPEGTPISRVRAIAKRLVGNTREELEADAEELFEELGSGGSQKPGPKGRPQERLRGGGNPEVEPDELDPKKLAEKVPRSF